jgi:replicative DNA helicase
MNRKGGNGNVVPMVSRPAMQVPHNIEAEQAVLAGILVNVEVWDDVEPLVSAGDFYWAVHQRIFTNIELMKQSGMHVDTLTLADFLLSRGELDQVGGQDYLMEMTTKIPSAANVISYAEIVRDKAMLRRMMDAGNRVVEVAMKNDGRSAIEIRDEVEATITHALDPMESQSKTILSSSDCLKQLFQRIDQAQTSGFMGLPTPWENVNEMTNGLRGGQLVVVAARPAMGKTSFALNMAEYTALESEKTVALFTLEMPGEELMSRLVSSVGNIAGNKIRSGDLDDEDWPKLSNAMATLRNAKLFIDERGGLTPSAMRSTARRIKRDHGLDLIVIDYIQLMQPDRVGENRNIEVGSITRSLKEFAKELNVPIVALSQLNRDVEKRANKRPMMSDLRDSGSVEQDADVIMFLYRDSVYNKDTDVGDEAEVIIGKQRSGDIGTCKLAFRGPYCRFDNLSSIYV